MAPSDAVPGLAEVVRRFKGHPGIRGKANLSLVAEVLGATDWVAGPGDDAAVVPAGDGYLLVAGEAIWPPLVETDPFGAGVAAVVANVNDVAAMGGRPVALVDTLVASEPAGREALEGLRWAADVYGVPVVGGHLTVREGAPALSAFVLGRASALLPATAVSPGQEILVAACLDGSLRQDIPVFTSVRERRDHLAGDIEVLPLLAEGGSCAAAKDVSMPGVLGSLAMLLEPTRTGAVVDLGRIPRPENVPFLDWMVAFPTYAFVLTCAPEKVEAARRPFLERGLACEPVGVTDDAGTLRVQAGGDEVMLVDLSEGVTGLRPSGQPR